MFSWRRIILWDPEKASERGDMTVVKIIWVWAVIVLLVIFFLS